MATSGIDKELYDSLNSLGILDVFDTITFNSFAYLVILYILRLL